eukprot:CAMPEP_0178966780 /NCGR_PEP_ID=MMETSP0789-20121207/17126_1 /TAXON_ID=3005 /ORGANISM="Rhizosolenia setigera, Strain CCMP 1694" /LENGTH=226 /DNA_ID=CAMNT_0020652111 /DNA_START=345 /DNA_END=1025 /DNA_ORIENTATION=+
MTKETFVYGYGTLSVIKDRYDNSFSVRVALGKGVVFYNRRDVLDWTLQRQNIYSLKGICNVAGEEGRIDLLEEVWSNVNDEDYKRTIFQHVDRSAARGGKINVLKWLLNKGLPIYWCAGGAARYGQLHVLQWLKEEKGLELNGDLYRNAIQAGQLNVMKWLREQEVDWYEGNSVCEAIEGNLEILQWLHDEGCPWPEDHRVYECILKPETLEWCRTNAYGGRIIVD